MKMLMTEAEFVTFVRRNLSTPTTFGELTGIILPKKHAEQRDIVVEFASETAPELKDGLDV